MARVRAGAFLVSGIAGGLVAFALANCASPTQIVIDVRADRSLCASLSTGIAVSTVENIDTEKLEVYETGCADGADQVGTLTITPSGADDDWVGVRVVGAVNGNDPDRCGLPGGPKNEPVWTDCVLARRRVQFIAGKTVNVTVRLAEQCVARYCGGALECNLGVCVQPEQVAADGGNTAPAKDGDLPIDVRIPDGAPLDAPVGGDACARCNGTTCNAGECIIDCNVIDCQNKTLCADGLNCTIECTQARCSNTRCATNGTCSFDCSGGNGQKQCRDIACAASTCNVLCRDVEGSCDGVYVDGGTNQVKCVPTTNSRTTCNRVECRGGTCTRVCSQKGCGPATVCSGNCAAWEAAQ